MSNLLLFHHDFIQVQAKYNIHRRRPGPSSYSRQVAGQDTEYEQNEDGITNLHYINNVDIHSFIHHNNPDNGYGKSKKVPLV